METGNFSLNFTSFDEEMMDNIKFVAYSLVAFPIVGIGIIGNLLSLLVLSRPNLKDLTNRTDTLIPIDQDQEVAGRLRDLFGVMYMYLLGLAMSNLCVLVTAIPALQNIKPHLQDISHGLNGSTYALAFYKAHLKVPIVNSFMASSVYIIIFMTINRYISIYKPTDFQRLHTSQNAKIHITLSFLGGILLHIPLCFENIVRHSKQGEEGYYYSEEREDFSSSLLFKTYIMISEILVRIGPIIILAVLNALIIYKFLRIAKRRHQLKRYSLQFSAGPPSSISECSHILTKTPTYQEETSSESLMKRKPVLERQISRTARRKSLQSPEERMLVLVLISIVILFVCCTTPAALLSIMFSSSLNGDLGFQIFRAVSNNLELVNFALNFYIYCLCSAEIRRAFLLTFLWCQQRDTKPGEATALSHL